MSQDTENPDISIIGELSHHVATHSKNSIVRCLVKIKNDGKILDRFIKDGGIDILSKLLKCQSAKILDITLSILANAFLKSTVRDEIHPRKIATNVVWIIKNLTPGISLHCRACRLIGNMAESIVHAKALFNVGVVSALGDVLSSKTNTQTLIMAIRAIRNIWTTMEQSQKEILDYGLVKHITTLLVSFKLKFQEDETLTKYKECAETCLKAIRAFVDTSDPRPGEQMKIKNNLCGFKCIVEYCKLNNRIAFQIVYQLSRVADHRPDLGSHGAIECIIAFLKSKQKDNLNSSFSGQVVMSLCFFSREAVNRRRIRDAGGLEVMLKLLETVHNEMHHVILLHALTEFVHNDESIAIMIKNGIVNVLVTRLKQMVFENRLENCDINDINTSSRKRTADDMSSPNKIKICNQVKHNRLSSGRYSLDLYTSDWSPRCASSTCSSPSKTSPIPYPTSDDSKDEDDNYSLVCSDNEDRIDEDSGTLYEEVDSLNSYVSSSIGKDDGGISMKSDKELIEMDTITEMNEVNLTHTCTLILLTRLTLWNDPIQALAHPTTIKALTCYIEISKNYHASLILSKIIKNHVYFLPLLLQGFVFEAQLLDNASGYLEKFCNMAESGGAFGELTRILLRGQESDKLMVAVSVPFLLRSKDKLRQLLRDYGGLKLIFNLLYDENHHLNENSVLSICQLANGLGIIPDTFEELLSSNDISFDANDILNNEDNKNNDGDKTKRKTTVTFELDDGGTVDVCRRLLCDKSEAFCAMLEGQFSEAGQNTVRLKEVSTEGFAVLCLTASGHLFNKNDNDNQGIEIESILDAVLLANKFLMVNEWRKLLETSMAQMYHGNLCRIWNWACLNSDHKFKICSVKYFLTSKISRDDRLSAFRDFAANENFKEFLEDIKDIVTEKLLIRQ